MYSREYIPLSSPLAMVRSESTVCWEKIGSSARGKDRKQREEESFELDV